MFLNLSAGLLPVTITTSCSSMNFQTIACILKAQYLMIENIVFVNLSLQKRTEAASFILSHFCPFPPRQVGVVNKQNYQTGQNLPYHGK